jgi:hypothetical protein
MRKLNQKEAIIQAVLKNPTQRNIRRLVELCRKLMVAQKNGSRRYTKLMVQKAEADRNLSAHIWRQQVHRSPSRR